MILFHHKKKLQMHLSLLPKDAISIALVPTMGALHEGHLSLVKKAIDENRLVVVSIFVNPTQFDKEDDLDKYPSTLEKDLILLSGISENLIVFAPLVSEIYPDIVNAKAYNFNGLENVMEGRYRKNHFNGVATVVQELFNIVMPNKAYFGEKDFQQLAIIKSLVKSANLSVEIIGCPIVRETNGLAMSSRNTRLSKENRDKAGFIYSTLKTAKLTFGTKSASYTIDWVKEVFLKHPLFNLEYFEIRDEVTFEPIEMKDNNKKYRAFIAVYIQEVRLIDNMALN
jgi:pantoate--beta-alanine ligase